MITFEQLNLSPLILKGIEDLGFTNPTPIQEAVIPFIFKESKDLVALAQTGTGKTAAYGLPLIHKLDLTNKYTEVLVLAPTRELCVQIGKDYGNYANYIPQVSIVSVYGGTSIENQRVLLKKGAKIICATPGRILDMLKRKYVDLSHLKYVVLDEADEMLDMGFKDDLDAILNQTPVEKQTLLFSATMPREVEEIANTYMNNPKRITIGERNSGADNVRHFYYVVQAKDRYLALKRIVDYYPDIYAIVFCRTRSETQEVSDKLIKDGYNADALHGDLSQAQRDHTMNRFRCKNIQILVATDVAARGLDVNNLTHVINYNLPDDTENYTHRSGRTGRADKSGISIAITGIREKSKIKLIEKSIGKQFTKVEIPNGTTICEKQLFYLINQLENVEVKSEEISDYLPVIQKRLAWLERDQLIERIVSLEFNRFLAYYKNAPDLNIPEHFSEPRNNSQKTKGKKEERNRRNRDENYVTLQINIGRRDDIGVDKLIRIINKTTQNRELRIGRIDLYDNCSKFEVPRDDAQEIIDAFQEVVFQNREIGVRISETAGSRKKHAESSGHNNSSKKNFKHKSSEEKTFSKSTKRAQSKRQRFW